MDGSDVTCWYGVFLDAYKYSSTYLLFSLSVMIISLLMIWIYEKPQFYKLIFKQSKHSTLLSPVQSIECMDENSIENMKEDSNNLFGEKKSQEPLKDEMEL